ncbi:MAG: hypothetical protein WCJ42_09015 [Actinomycetes bacterium]
MNDSAEVDDDEFTRLLLRVVSAAQGVLENALAPGGVVETVAGAIAGLIDEVNSGEVRANLSEAGAALSRAWGALIAGSTPGVPPQTQTDVPSD